MLEHEFAASTNGRSSPAGNGSCMARVSFDALMHRVWRPFDKGEANGQDAAFRLA